MPIQSGLRALSERGPPARTTSQTTGNRANSAKTVDS